MPQTRREAALELSEDLLTDIELNRIPATDLVRKTSRLARLLDDTDAVEWLSFEINGFSAPSGIGMTTAQTQAAIRSGRGAWNDEKKETLYWTPSIASLQADADGARQQLASASDAPVSISSANPYQVVGAPRGNARERTALRQLHSERVALVAKIIGAIHGYVSERFVELRFGAAAESAFDALRARVDSQIASLAPSAATKLAAAFENASSGNPEHWANAAAECRRLLQALADELRPAGDPVDGRPMTEANYVNRLIDWIVRQKSVGKTFRDVAMADLEDIGKRIDALQDAGHKGVHDEVSQFEAARFLIGVYMLVGDILTINDESTGSQRATGQGHAPEVSQNGLDEAQLPARAEPEVPTEASQ